VAQAKDRARSDLQAAFVQLLEDDKALRLELARSRARRVLERISLREKAIATTGESGRALRAVLRVRKGSGRSRDHARALELYRTLGLGPSISMREVLEFVASGDPARPTSSFRTARPRVKSKLERLRIVARECKYDSVGQAWEYLNRMGVEDLPPRRLAREARL